MTLGVTPSQTVGPYLAICLPWPEGPDVVPPDSPGAITISGRVLDGAGAPVPDALVETWQADPNSRFDHPDDPRGAVPSAVAGFRGFGRSATSADGTYLVRTLRPGALPSPGGGSEAPHLDVLVFARGLLNRVATRLYFDGDPANAEDPVLMMIDPARQPTLLAQRDGNDMLSAARTLREAAAQHDVCADPACAALVLASVVVATTQPPSRSVERKLP